MGEEIRKPGRSGAWEVGASGGGARFKGTRGGAARWGPWLGDTGHLDNTCAHFNWAICAGAAQRRRSPSRAGAYCSERVDVN